MQLSLFSKVFFISVFVLNLNSYGIALEEKNQASEKTSIDKNGYCLRGPRGPAGPQGPPGTGFKNYVCAFNSIDSDLPAGENLLFETPVAIQGITYNSTTGVFTVNQSGVYQLNISSTVFQQDGSKFQVLINNVQVGESLTLVSSPGSLTYIQALNAGDTIQLKAIDSSAALNAVGIISLTINQIN